MNSAIYTGIVQHRRHAPAHHTFRYRMFQPYLDLDELDSVFADRWLWSVERRNVAAFHRADFHGEATRPLMDCVRESVETALGPRAWGPVRVLAHLRYFGYSFNPVAFYYGFDPDGTRLDWILAEITNTPWRQRYSYVLDVATAERKGPLLEWTFDKAFHVSPFLPMQRSYRWRLGIPADRLLVHMDVSGAAGREFDASLSLERRPLDASTLARCLAHHPWMSAKVIGAIHWQALRLWLKGVPVHDHPDTAARRASRTH